MPVTPNQQNPMDSVAQIAALIIQSKNARRAANTQARGQDINAGVMTRGQDLTAQQNNAQLQWNMQKYMNPQPTPQMQNAGALQSAFPDQLTPERATALFGGESAADKERAKARYNPSGSSHGTWKRITVSLPNGAPFAFNYHTGTHAIVDVAGEPLTPQEINQLQSVAPFIDPMFLTPEEADNLMKRLRGEAIPTPLEQRLGGAPPVPTDLEKIQVDPRNGKQAGYSKTLKGWYYLDGSPVR